MELTASSVAIFFIGFAIGALACFITMAQIYKHKRVKDELLKTKRAAIKSQRTLDRFLKTSLDLFSQLDTVHKQYVEFLNEATQRIAPQEVDIHPFLNTTTTLNSVINKSEKKKKDITEDQSINGSLNEIATPKVLQSPEIPKDATLSAIDENVQNSPLHEAVTDTKQEEKEQLIFNINIYGKLQYSCRYK